MIDRLGTNLIFLLSVPRSGSTLLAAILAGHREVLCPPEPWLLLPLSHLAGEQQLVATHYDHNLAMDALIDLAGHDTLLEASRSAALSVYNSLLLANNKRVFVDKTPRYYHVVEYIEHLFPAARKLWLCRDPFDVIASFKKTWGISIEELTGEIVSPHTFDVTIGLANLSEFFASNDLNRAAISYEDLVRQPEETVQRICRFLGLAYDPDIIHYGRNDNIIRSYKQAVVGDRALLAHPGPHDQSIGLWEQILTRQEIAAALHALGRKVFLSMGYAGSMDRACELTGLSLCSVPETGKIDQIRGEYARYLDNSIGSSPGLAHTSINHQLKTLRERLLESETDREQRLETIENQGKQLGELNAELAAARAEAKALRQQVKDVDADREARLQVIRQQGVRLGELEGERNRLKAEVADLKDQTKALEADRAARLAVIEQQGRELGQLEGELNVLRASVASLQRQVAEIDADREARLRVIEDQGNRLGQTEGERNRLLGEVAALKHHLKISETDRAARLQVIEQQGRAIEEHARLLAQLQQENADLAAQLKGFTRSLRWFTRSLRYRLTHPLDWRRPT